MSDNKSKKQHSSSTPFPKKNPVQETLEEPPPPPQPVVAATAAPTFLSPPPPPPPPPASHQELLNPKRPRYTSSTGQWKLLPSPSQKQNPTNVTATDSPVTHAAASSSDTASSPSQDTSKPEQERDYTQHQLRKGKYVSPVWKPNEMLWLAKAWRIQYQGSGTDHALDINPTATSQLPGRGKTRATKDREVSEFLNRNGVNRDAKTAGTKWDNMLGEFRKVYEWERGGEREQIGKSYFRLSPYERKLYRLPASFDEEVFEELAQFMCSRMRTPPFVFTSGAEVADRDSRLAIVDTKSFPYSPISRDDEVPSSYSGRGGRHMMAGGGGEYYDASSTKEMRRIGKVRMVWEELVSLWGEDGEHHRGRVKVQGTSFLNADELAFFDDAMVTCTLEAFEDANSPLRGFSVDRFLPGQQVKVFGRRKSTQARGLVTERPQALSLDPSIRSSITSSTSSWEFQDPTEYYLGCLHVPPSSLPSLLDLPWYLQQPPPEQFRFPIRKDLFRDLPQGKELFFTTSSEPLDCRSITLEILSPIARSNPTLTITTRESFIGLWDDCINSVVSKFSNLDMIFIRKPSYLSNNGVQDQWPNVTGFVRNFCLWRGEETDRLREVNNNNNNLDPSSLLVRKLLWSYVDLPYILGYYAVGSITTFCALSRTHDTLIRTDLHTVDLSTPGDRIKALVPCWRIAGLLSLLSDRCANIQQINKSFPYSDFERIDLGNHNIIELTPNYMTRVFPTKRKWLTVKEIYDFLDHRIPHAEYICQSSEQDLSLSFKPRGCRLKLSNFEQLVEVLKHVTKALVALHDLSFVHRDLRWDKVMRRVDRENEWFVIGFDEAASAPQIYPSQHEVALAAGSATLTPPPEMKGRGMHGVKVDVWGVGQMLKTCGLVGLPKALRELQNRCLDQNPEQRPTAADCYHHLLQLQSSMTAGGGDY